MEFMMIPVGNFKEVDLVFVRRKALNYLEDDDDKKK
jgi:hypothetical protein